MKPDLVSYRRALNTSLIGLAIQAVISLLLFVYAFSQRDHAAMSATIIAALGMVSWVTLIVIFDQHRRERIEAFEQESYEHSSEAAASVFDRSSDDLRIALKRLRGLYRFFLPAMGILIGGGLVGIGFARLGAAQRIADPANFPEQGNMLFAMLASVATALIGFIFARFCAGMAKQTVWTNLGAGATAAIAASVAAALVFAGHAVQLVGSDNLHRWVTIAMPILMIALGAEFIINQLLEIYRPRRRDEWARPAFDSRVLGVLAAPDRAVSSVGDAISYQLGADVSESWLYRLVRKWAGALVLLGIVIGWLLTSLAVLKPHEEALLLRFGRLVTDDNGDARTLGPGLHLKAPWPIDRVVVPEFVLRDTNNQVAGVVRTATGLRTIPLGTPEPADRSKAILWTDSHGPNEVFSIVRAGDTAVGGGGTDLALAAVEAPVQYVVGDVEAFERLASPDMRDKILRAVGQREVTRFLATKRLDDVIGAGRDRLAGELWPLIEAAYGDITRRGGEGAIPTGVRVVHVGAHGFHPPKDAAPGYERVVQQAARNVARLTDAQARAVQTRSRAAGSPENARAIVEMLDTRHDPLVDERQRLRDETPGASPERREQIAQRLREIDKELDSEVFPALREMLASGGVASEILAQAQASRVQTVMRARVQLLNTQGRSEAYGANPMVYRGMLYFDMLGEVLAGKRVYIVDDTIDNLILELGLEDTDDTNVTFGAPEEQ